MEAPTTEAAVEVNFDGLVGPTHNYAGLAFGNRASMNSTGDVSAPRAAALEGLEKMKLLGSLGCIQAVLPPQERPHLPTLRRLGFTGTESEILDRVAREAPRLLARVSSASCMWAANAATVSPAADTGDGRTHFTPANLAATAHRSLEAPATARLLRTIFADETRFAHHAPLPCAWGDEGAANHTRLCSGPGAPGVEFFVYGAGGPDRSETERGDDARMPRFPARQSFDASAAVARLHDLRPDRTVFARQHPVAIDAGVFHNDVIAVGHENVLLYHEDAFADEQATRDDLTRAFAATGARSELHFLRVPRERLGLGTAVSSYLFNSQLVRPPAPGNSTGMILVLPAECENDPAVRGYVDELVSEDNPVARALYVNVRQSMRNGGGPACLRLRVVLSSEERAAVSPGVFLDDALEAKLREWIVRRYRETLRPEDLADPLLLRESRAALDELTSILGLGSLYEFQTAGG